MNVEIKNRDTLATGGQCFQACDGDVVEVAEPHCPGASCMMPRRTHQAEHRLPCPGSFQCLQRRARGCACITGDSFVKRRIHIEIAGLCKSVNMLLSVCPQ